MVQFTGRSAHLIMPIKAENRARYPKDWYQIRARIQARAGNKCEQCGVPNGRYIYRDDAGDWHECGLPDRKYEQPMLSTDAVKAMGFKPVLIVCTTAHLDHTPENYSDNNLRFWCQKCHLAYDHEHHQRNARETRRKGKAAADMFESSDNSDDGRGTAR